MNGQRDLYGITGVFVGKYFSVNVLQKNVVLMRFCIKGSKFNSNAILSTEKKRCQSKQRQITLTEKYTLHDKTCPVVVLTGS